VSAVVKWGLSPLDWRSHAVDEWADHPIGVYRAQCGHLLMMVTALLKMPYGKRCEACAVARDTQ
jgi:hypothetical protein